MNRTPIISGAVMLDRVLGEIQKGLASHLDWLDYAFGRAERVTSVQQGKRYVRPSVYAGDWKIDGANDYLDMLPDSKIGNFSFFIIDDPQRIETGPGIRTITSPASLVVWFDLRRVYGEADNRNTEYLKAQILGVLGNRTSWRLRDGRFEVTAVYEQAQNIYRGFTIDEVDNQFLIHPFGGFRFEGTLKYNELCEI